MKDNCPYWRVVLKQIGFQLLNFGRDVSPVSAHLSYDSGDAEVAFRRMGNVVVSDFVDEQPAGHRIYIENAEDAESNATLKTLIRIASRLRNAPLMIPLAVHTVRLANENMSSHLGSRFSQFPQARQENEIVVRFSRYA